MTATDVRQGTVGEPEPEPVRLESRPRHDGRGPGVLRRRLPIVAIVLAVALGFAFGHVFDTGKSTPKSIVTSAEINNAVASSGHGATGSDRGFSQLENGVQHNHGFELPVDPADRVLLAHQMDLSRQTALEYPTLADAEKAGLRRAGPFSPGLGTHMINFVNSLRYGVGAGPMTDAQITHPLAWIYDGTKPTSRVAGLFYSANVSDPAGFAGLNDVWHQHKSICIVFSKGNIDAPLGADRDATKAECDAYKGVLIPATGPLLHVWTVPGYEDCQGVFAHLNPAITCNDGTYYTVDIKTIGYRLSACRDGGE